MNDSALAPEESAIFPVLDVEPFDLEQKASRLEAIRLLVKKSRHGILTTVDEMNCPQARWMASLSVAEFPWIYTLTSGDSRKVGQIERQPEVNWMFCNSDLSLVVNLRGEARIIRGIEALKNIWKMIPDKEESYFLRESLSGLGFVGVATKVESAECCTPRNSRKFTIRLS